MSRNTAPVVIVRKAKKQHRFFQAAAFAATGGASALYTVPKAVSNEAYNQRTRNLQAEAETGVQTTSDPLGAWLQRRRLARAQGH